MTSKRKKQTSEQSEWHLLFIHSIEVARPHATLSLFLIGTVSI